MKLALLFVTCDRWEETCRTLGTFFQHNRAEDFAMMLHADDASTEQRILSLTKVHDFECITAPAANRRGGQHMRYLLINEAARRGASHVLILENDWISERPVPHDAIAQAFSFDTVYHMRLYHDYRERYEDGSLGRKVGLKSGKGPSAKVEETGWLPLARDCEPLEINEQSFWGAPPGVTRIGEALWMHEGTVNERGCRERSQRLGLRVVRVTKNVFWHIGYNTTPGFKA